MARLGKKAESLLKLKERGLFGELIIFENLPEKEQFIEKMRKEGFKDGEDLAVRFSSFETSVNLPRSIILDSFEKVYDFIKINLNEKINALVHRFIMPKFGGTLLKQDGKIYLSLINGAWEQETSHECDNAIIENGKAKLYFIPNEKECLFVERDKLVKKKVINKKEGIKKLVRLIYSKINKSELNEKVLYEFNVTPSGELCFLEFRENIKFDELNFEKNPEVLEIKSIEDLRRWDRNQEILLSVKISREKGLDFLKMIELIKPYKKHVYVRYGMCSHPCIILRENRINPLNYFSNCEIIEFNLD